MLGPLRAQRRRLGVCLSARRLRQVGHLLGAVLPLLPARLSLADAQAGVHRDPVEPGRESALSPEAFYVSPDPDPNLLAGILGALGAQHAKRHSIYKTRIILNEFRERRDVALGSARDQRPVLGSAVLSTHPEVASVSAKLGVDSRQVLFILRR